MNTKKYSKILLFILALMLLCNGCDKNKAGDITPVITTSPVPTKAVEKYSVHKEYPDKICLNWLTIGEMPDDVSKEFNKKLVEKGYNFVVNFSSIDEKGDEYQKAIRTMKKNNDEVDILCSDFGVGGQYSTTYDDCVRDGIYESLNSYLDSELGQKLYKSRDSKLWSSMDINGKIYGMDNRALPGSSTYLIFNKKLVDQYQIDLSKFSGKIEDLGSILKKVYEGEKNNKSVTTFAIDEIVHDIGLYDYITEAVGVRLDKPEAVAVNLFKDDYLVNYFTAIKKYHDAGYLRSVTGIRNNFFVTIWLGYGVNTYDEIAINNTFQDYDGNSIDVIPIKIADAYVANLYNAVTGITAWSKHKKEAFELLTLLNTDSEFGNLLAYGVKGKDYNLFEGKVKPTKDDDISYWNTWLYTNQQIIYPSQEEPLTKRKDIEEYQHTVKASPILGFHFDPSNVMKEINATDSVISQYGVLWSGQEEDLESTLHKLNSELKEAGIDKVVEEVNRQLKEWKKKNSN
jgi:ABC-type sugar transport system, periplasmic component